MKETALEKAQARYIWCSALGQFFDEATGQRSTVNAFNSMNTGIAEYGKTGVNSAAAILINSPDSRKADTATYVVGEPLLVTEKTKKGDTTQLNLWRPSDFVPATNVSDADVEPWLRHMKLIFGEGGSLDHILNVLSFWAQKRGHKINHAVVVYGETQGTGKDSCFVPLMRFLGDNNVKNISPSDIIGQFNPFLCAELVVVNEMNNFKSRETMDRMKSWLAAPPWMITINMKFAQPFHIPNRMNCLIYTNHADALRMEDSDRRFWVHECLLTTPMSAAYYDALYKFYDNGGCEMVIGWLMQRDISAFNPKVAPPMTNAKREMINAGLPEPIRWLRKLFAEDGEGFASRTVVTVAEVKRMASKRDWGVPDGINDKTFMAALRAEGFEAAPRMRIGPDMMVLWARGEAAKLDGNKMRARYYAETGTGPVAKEELNAAA